MLGICFFCTAAAFCGDLAVIAYAPVAYSHTCNFAQGELKQKFCGCNLFPMGCTKFCRTRLIIYNRQSAQTTTTYKPFLVGQNRKYRIGYGLQVDPSSFSLHSHRDAGQQFPSSGGPHSTGSEATPAAALAKKQSLHLEEAKEMCPEGHVLSESYGPEGLPYMPTSKLCHRCLNQIGRCRQESCQL